MSQFKSKADVTAFVAEVADFIQCHAVVRWLDSSVAVSVTGGPSGMSVALSESILGRLRAHDLARMMVSTRHLNVSRDEQVRMLNELILRRPHLFGVDVSNREKFTFGSIVDNIAALDAMLEKANGSVGVDMGDGPDRSVVHTTKAPAPPKLVPSTFGWKPEGDNWVPKAEHLEVVRQLSAERRAHAALAEDARKAWERGTRLADEAGALRSERDDLLKENATLRRTVERLERRAKSSR